jgi:hypothetical protein
VLVTVVGVVAVVVFGAVADVPVATGWRCVPVGEPSAALEDAVPELAPPAPDTEDAA